MSNLCILSSILSGIPSGILAGTYPDPVAPGNYTLAQTEAPHYYLFTVSGDIANNIRAAIAQTRLALDSAILANTMAKLECYKLLESILSEAGIHYNMMWILDDWSCNDTEAEVLVYID